MHNQRISNTGLESRAQQMTLIYMGVLRARYLSTATLNRMLKDWAEECDSDVSIPVDVLIEELRYRAANPTPE